MVSSEHPQQATTTDPLVRIQNYSHKNDERKKRRDNETLGIKGGLEEYHRIIVPHPPPLRTTKAITTIIIITTEEQRERNGKQYYKLCSAMPKSVVIT